MSVRRFVQFGLLGLFSSSSAALAETRATPHRLTYNKVLVPDARRGAITWRYTTEWPGKGWSKPGFDDSSWHEGAAGFGTAMTPGGTVRTVWDSGDLWLRRTVEIHAETFTDPALMMHHDEDVEVYINGVRAVRAKGYTTDYELAPISIEGKAALRTGKNVVAVHCHQKAGGQYIDLGLVDGSPSKSKGYFPPSVPLVVHDPYFSIWSNADHLTDDWTRHWTGRLHSLTSMVRIDGTMYRLMGLPESPIPPLPQTALMVLPTRTLYRFEGGGVHVGLTFITPALPEDLDVLARPLTYLNWEVAAADGKRHDVSIYFDASAELTVNDPVEKVAWSRAKVPGLIALRIGSQDQPILARTGDGVRIDWGYLYAAAAEGQVSAATICGQAQARGAFAAGGSPPTDDPRMPRSARDDMPVLAFRFDIQGVADHPQTRTLMLAYDEVESINLMGKPLRPYWRRNGQEPADLLATASKEFESLRARCERFDKELMDDLRTTGGAAFERIGSLAYRQALAGCTLAADERGRPLMFAKENTSNGCISTVDVQYPACPLFLLFNPELLEAHLTPVLDYAETSRWPFLFAPHDLGTYPKATGQVYGGGERTEDDQMPVEESGDMLLMIAGICKGSGDASYAGAHWPELTKWADYLKLKGFDPENQLCTDDFAGHLAHNVNLSAKAIVAIGAYAMMGEMLGKKEQAAADRKLAEELARRWVTEAAEGDHTLLAFDKPGTWSQKYNLVWDQVLGLKLFPAEIVRKEMAFYRKGQQHVFGLPLDSRADYTKLDWLLWTATLGGSRQDFDALVAPVSEFLAAGPSRVPMTDFYSTTTGKTRGMFARPVIGGVFIKMLDDEALWRKWASRARAAKL